MVDSRTALLGTQPDYGQKAQSGFRLGAEIQDRPEQRQMTEIQAGGLQRQDAQNAALAVYSAFGDEYKPEALTMENAAQFIELANKGGAQIDIGESLDISDLPALNNMYEAGKGLFTQQMAAKRGGLTKRVQSTSDLGGGAVQMVFNDGTTSVVTPNAEQMEAIKVAQDENITYEEALNKARGEGRAFGAGVGGESALDETTEQRKKREADELLSKKQAEQSAEQLDTNLQAAAGLDKQISILEEAHTALMGGAESGALSRYAPSIKKETIQLENAAKRLGLGVISSVTFGALSASELKVAMDTALPLHLSEEDLKAHIKEKQAALTKIRDTMEEAAIFFSEGGTKVDWLKKQREIRKGSKGGGGGSAKDKLNALRAKYNQGVS